MRPTSSHRPGFALVLALAVMAFMVLVVLTLAGLLRVESQAAAVRQSGVAARLNALAAVRLAQSAVQQSLGPDTRISAPASIHEDPAVSSATTPGADPFEYPLTGVWRSWEGLDHDTRVGVGGVRSRYSGRPQKPDYEAKLRRYDPSNPSKGRFLGWLISSGWGYGGLAPAPDGTIRPPAPIPATSQDGSVALVGPASDPSAVRQVHLVPLSLADGKPLSAAVASQLTSDAGQGAFAWWVGGENQKALATFSPAPSGSTSARERSSRIGTFGRPDLEAAGLVAPDAAHEVAALPSRRLIDRYVPASPPARLSAVLAAGARSAGFHDVTHLADGLLTNAATGGLRKDLSLLTEMWEKMNVDDPARAARLPLFRNRPAARRLTAAEADHDLPFTRPYPDSRFPGDWGNRNRAGENTRHNLMYWWADYGTNNGAWTAAALSADGGSKFGGISSYPPIRSWAYLADHVLHYRRYVASGNGPEGEVRMDAPRPVASADGGQHYTYYERVHRHPLVARIEYVFAAAAVGSNPAVLVQPIVTIWNPYNVRLDVPAFTISPRWRDLPLAFELSVGTPDPLDPSSVSWTTPVLRHARDWGGASWDMVVPASSLRPGQTRVFSHGVGGSLADLQRLNPGQGPHAGNLVAGYTASPRSGTLMVETRMAAAAGSRLRFRLVKRIDWPDTEIARNSIYVDSSIPNFASAPAARYSYTGVSQADFLLLYGADATAASEIVLETAQGTPRAFGMFSFGLRLSNDGIAQYTSRTGIKTISKGLMQSSPFVTYTELGMKSATELTPFPWSSASVFDFGKVPLVPVRDPFYRFTTTINPDHFSANNPAYCYSGSLNLLNAPFDFYTYELTDFTGSGVPQCDPASNEGYVLTGLDPSTGLGKAVVAELPVRPLQSLAELQSCDIRATNPAPPFAYYLIGNSDASPVLPPDDPVGRHISQATAAVQPRDRIAANHLQYDDSYCLNHVLFDDWFVSSLAPPPSSWASLYPPAGTEFSWNPDVLVRLQETWAEVRSGAARLPNACYAPLASAAGFSLDTTTASLLGSDPPVSPHFLRIAAHLKVTGQFNVNSQSTVAWRALLGHLRAQEVPCLPPGAMTTVAEAADNPLSRMQVSPERAASGGGMSRAVLGFAALTDTQLDRLAEEIVSQVRLRGPFLSLSEFVNRRLAEADGTDTDLSLGGTLAMALRKLESVAATHPAAGARAYGKDVSTYDGLRAVGLLPPAAINYNLPGARNFALGEWTDTLGRYTHPKAAEGNSNFGVPGWPRQADLLRPLAPVIAVRDDTLVVRACGVAGRVTVWCEMILVRTPDYVDSRVPAWEGPHGDAVAIGTVGLVNASLGRRYRVAGFRWLAPGEL